ncbi:MAG: LLM class flavin-dependent oxidoreductase [Acidimicrobiia bacterium]|nr:LLM class flavin-dependent oxidoreductase [Acidimicrobiia bacterium]
MGRAKYGLTLSNRSVLLGLSSMEEMNSLARAADRAEVWDSVWLGDSIFAKPRVDALVALGALAAQTERVKLGVGCMASTPLRDALLMAYQWLSFDFVSGGRSIFVACQGQREAGGGQFEEEFAAFGIDPSTRSRRMEEAIEVLRLVSETENASYRGTYNSFEGVTVLPRPLQQPLPIWITGHANPAFPKLSERILRRIARLGDGWMTSGNTPESLATTLATIKRYGEDECRPPGDDFEACLYYNIHVTEDPDRGMEEVESYMRDYYFTDYDRGFLERWVAIGDPSECIRRIKEFADAGATTITLRIAAYDEAGQFRRVTEEILPALVK